MPHENEIKVNLRLLVIYEQKSNYL